MTVRVAAVSLMVIFGLALQATVFKEINLFGLVPDLVLIIVVTFSLLKGPWFGGCLGLCAGLLGDLLMGGVIGLGAMAKMTTGFLAGLMEKSIFKDNLFVPFIFLFVGTLIHESLYLFLAAVLGWPFGTVLYLIPKVLTLSLYNAALAPLIYSQCYRLERRLEYD